MFINNINSFKLIYVHLGQKVQERCSKCSTNLCCINILLGNKASLRNALKYSTEMCVAVTVAKRHCFYKHIVRHDTLALPTGIDKSLYKFMCVYYESVKYKINIIHIFS